MHSALFGRCHRLTPSSFVCRGMHLCLWFYLPKIRRVVFDNFTAFRRGIEHCRLNTKPEQDNESKSSVAFVNIFFWHQTVNFETRNRDLNRRKITESASVHWANIFCFFVFDFFRCCLFVRLNWESFSNAKRSSSEENNERKLKKKTCIWLRRCPIRRNFVRLINFCRIVPLNAALVVVARFPCISVSVVSCICCPFDDCSNSSALGHFR